MPQLGKNQAGAGQFAGVEAARHAKHNGVADNTGIGAGHDGGGIDFLHAEFGKQGTECTQLFGKQRADGFNGYIFFCNPRTAGQKNHLGL